MFSDFVTMHGVTGNHNMIVRPQHHKPRILQKGESLAKSQTSLASAPASVSRQKADLTCTQLLVLSGALSAAMPTMDPQQMKNLYTKLQQRHHSAPAIFTNPDGKEHENGPCEWSDGEDEFGDQYLDDYSSDEDDSPPSAFIIKKNQFQKAVKDLVEHKYFSNLVLGAIMCNTFSMGIEYHNQVMLSITILHFLVNLIISFFYFLQSCFVFVDSFIPVFKSCNISIKFSEYIKPIL